MSFRFPDEPSKWVAACEVLASLQHLEELQITIALWCPMASDRHANEPGSVVAVLEPLMVVRAAKFTVILTESVTEEIRERLGSMPFRLLQREKPGRGYFSKDDD